MPAGKAHRVNDQFPDLKSAVFTDDEVAVLKEIAAAIIAKRDEIEEGSAAEEAATEESKDV